MIDSLFAQGSSIAVAVAFDDHTVPLIRFASKLALRTGKKLALIHVAEPPLVAQPVAPFMVPSILWDKMPELAASHRAEAKRKLAALKEHVVPGVEVKSVVAEGHAAESLAKQAQQVDAALIVVGTRVNSKSFVPRGFSAALSLMASAPVPVLAMDTERHMPDFDLPFRILIADDLEEHTEPAVAVAAALAESLKKSWVHHVYVSALTSANLETALRNAALAAHTILPAKEAAEVFKAVHARQRAELEARFSDFREYVEAAEGKYTCEVTPGDVGGELDSAVRTYHLDLLVFGRHHGIHHDPWSFGRMPFRAMMGFGLPVLVVPGPDLK